MIFQGKLSLLVLPTLSGIHKKDDHLDKKEKSGLITEDNEVLVLIGISDKYFSDKNWKITWKLLMEMTKIMNL